MNRASLKAAAKQQIQGTLGTFFLISLIITLASTAVGLIPVVGGLVSIGISAVATLAIHRIYLALTRDNRKPAVGDLFSHFDDCWSAVKLYLLETLYIFLWSLLLVIPGIIKMYSYAMATFILAENPGMSANEALRRSSEMMNGHKREYFILSLSFYGWTLVGALTLGLGFIWITPYMNATFANYYLYLKNGSNA